MVAENVVVCLPCRCRLWFLQEQEQRRLVRLLCRRVANNEKEKDDDDDVRIATMYLVGWKFVTVVSVIVIVIVVHVLASVATKQDLIVIIIMTHGAVHPQNNLSVCLSVGRSVSVWQDAEWRGGKILFVFRVVAHLFPLDRENEWIIVLLLAAAAAAASVVVVLAGLGRTI